MKTSEINNQVETNLESGLLNKNRIDPIVEQAVAVAKSKLAPTWDVRDFVAVNPFFAMRDKSFLEAIRFVEASKRAYLFAEPLFYKKKFEAGEIAIEDVKFALDQIKLREGIFNNLELNVEGAINFINANKKSEREQLFSLSDCYDIENADNISALITKEISKWLAAYFDEGQALWSMPYREHRLYYAWRMNARFDKKIDKKGFPLQKLIESLPADPMQAIEVMFDLINQKIIIDQSEMSNYIHRLISSVQGWASYLQKFEFEAQRDNNDTLLKQVGGVLDIIAIRMAYDVVLIDKIVSLKEFKLHLTLSEKYLQKSNYEYVWQLAFEQSFRRKLLKQIRPIEILPDQQVPEAQFVFCIDVRSEVIRRHIENVMPNAQTLGFAGFFGVPVSIQNIGHGHDEQNCPILLTPQAVVKENSDFMDKILSKKLKNVTFERMKKEIKTSANSCFTFVESMGWTYIFKMLSHASGSQKTNIDFNSMGLTPDEVKSIRMDVSHIDLTKRAQIGFGALKNMGLTSNFAPMVFLFGHESETSNNPYAGGLDCGACAGHSGLNNSRTLATILNDSEVRAKIKELFKVEIPSATSFISGVHNTTRDKLLIDRHIGLENVDQSKLNLIEATLSIAGTNCAKERLSKLGIKDDICNNKLEKELNQRANNWSEIRPEMGLAGNAAFVIARRSRTYKMPLWGKSFLHDYDQDKDADLSILELIMTAPMVVTNWINMQYYASAVDTDKFGTGNKVIHNVVGTIGCVQGNGSDLLTGLSEQSVKFNGEYMHEPIRLQVVIEASTDRISQIIDKHQMVLDLVNNEWLNVISIDPKTGEKNLYQSRGWMRL
jgi:uncharacterized protein YbcC (UPF0753/DUF2309 family)